MLWDVVLSVPARLFLDRLPAEQRSNCHQTILDDLCYRPRPEDNPGRQPASYFPNRPGIIECVISGWHFRYRILNANTIEVVSVNRVPNDPMARP